VGKSQVHLKGNGSCSTLNRKKKKKEKTKSFVNSKLQAETKVHGTEKRVYVDRSMLNFIVMISLEKHVSFIYMKTDFTFSIPYCTLEVAIS